MTNSQYKPVGIKIEIDGKNIDIEDKSSNAKFIEDILSVSVEESLHMPSMCTIVINNSNFSGRPEEDKIWQHQNLVQIGKTIKIELESSTTASFTTDNKNTVFEGEITAIECHFTSNSQAPIFIRAYDVSHRLHRGRHNRSFQNSTDSDIVNKIVAEAGIQKGKIESSGAPHDYVFQENQTNMEFLRERAFRIGFELYVQDNRLNFSKPQEKASLNLKWLNNLHSFRVKVTSAEQVNSVEVRGWDYQKKSSIVAVAQREQVITENQNGKGSQINSKFKSAQAPKMIVVDQPVFSLQEATQMAQAIFNELGGEFISAEAIAEGDPTIRVGKVVNLQEMGPYDGKYYVTETRHLYHKRAYTTEFTVKGLRGGTLFNLLAPSTQLQPGQTFLVGIVTDNNDPEGWGRVKVKFPTLTEDHSSNWGRVVGLGAANQRGFYCLPEINDEVLVGFEHGDIHRPYIIGGVWNGQDKTPDSVQNTIENNKVRLRTFETRTGHKLQFVEESKGNSKAGIYLETAGGHKISLNDGDREIEIKTNGGHYIKMDDNMATISVESIGNLSLKARGNIDIKANGMVTIQGVTIKLN